MIRRSLVLVATAVGFFTSDAQAEAISIHIASIEKGALLIAGRVSGPNLPVSLPKLNLTTTSAEEGNFIFFTRHLPDSCVIQIKTEAITVDAIVNNCSPRGPKGDSGIDGVAGYERIVHECRSADLVGGYCLVNCPSEKKILGGSCSGGKSVSARSGASPSQDQWRCFGPLDISETLIAQAFCAAIRP